MKVEEILAKIEKNIEKAKEIEYNQFLLTKITF